MGCEKFYHLPGVKPVPLYRHMPFDSFTGIQLESQSMLGSYLVTCASWTFALWPLAMPFLNQLQWFDMQ